MNDMVYLPSLGFLNLRYVVYIVRCRDGSGGGIFLDERAGYHIEDGYDLELDADDMRALDAALRFRND